MNSFLLTGVVRKIEPNSIICSSGGVVVGGRGMGEIAKRKKESEEREKY